MGITVDPKISERVLALAANELRRMAAANDAWQGAYRSMNVADGDNLGWRVSGLVQTLEPSPGIFQGVIGLSASSQPSADPGKLRSWPSPKTTWRWFTSGL